MRRPALLLLALLLLAACGSEPAIEDDAPEADMAEATGEALVPRLEEAWRVTAGLDRPESVVYDAARDVLYVSNIRGGGTDQDGNGFLSKVGPEGAVIEAEWVGGLDGPKGLALDGDRLYVSDIDEVVAVDVTTGEVVERYTVEGAEFLNDVAVGDAGEVYITDMNTSKVHRLADGQIETWLEDADVLSPNGVHLMDGDVIVAAADASAENAGGARYLRRVSTADQSVTPLTDATPLGGLDAVEPDERGGLFLSDWGAGQVMYFTPETGATLLLELSQGTADLDYVADEGLLYLPVMESDQLIAYRVVWP